MPEIAKADMAGRIAATAAPGGLHTVANADSGNLCRFIAAHDFTPGDKLVFNGVQFAVRNSDGGEFATGAWKAGDEVIMSVCNGYVKVLAPLHGKANVGRPQHVAVPHTHGTRTVDGYPDPICYITDGNIVVVSATIQLVNGAPFTPWNICLSLPAGFRPAQALPYMPILTDMISSGARYIHGIRISTGGSIVFIPVFSGVGSLDCEVLHIHATFAAS